MESLTPTSHAEAVAVFRHGIIGSLTQAQREPGQLIIELKALSKKHFRPPNSVTTKRVSFSTLERWYYQDEAQNEPAWHLSAGHVWDWRRNARRQGHRRGAALRVAPSEN